MVSWELEGFTIDEGPRPGRTGEDRYEYYYLILKEDRKVFHYCLWAVSATVSKLASAQRTTENVIIESLKRKAHQQVEHKIKTKDFTNVVLMINDQGEKEVPLDELDVKLL